MRRPPVLRLAVASAVAWAATAAALITGAPARLYALVLGVALVTAMGAAQAGLTRMTDDEIADMLTQAMREAVQHPRRTPAPPRGGSVRYIGDRAARNGGAR